jgi:hypothetical protein
MATPLSPPRSSATGGRPERHQPSPSRSPTTPNDLEALDLHYSSSPGEPSSAPASRSNAARVTPKSVDEALAARLPAHVKDKEPAAPRLRSVLVVNRGLSFKDVAAGAPSGSNGGQLPLRPPPRGGGATWHEVRPRYWWRKMCLPVHSRLGPLEPPAARRATPVRDRLGPRFVDFNALLKSKDVGKCFNCFARDHRISGCRDPPRCLLCGRSGHKARYCARPPFQSDFPLSPQPSHPPPRSSSASPRSDSPSPPPPCTSPPCSPPRISPHCRPASPQLAPPLTTAPLEDPELASGAAGFRTKGVKACVLCTAALTVYEHDLLSRADHCEVCVEHDLLRRAIIAAMMKVLQSCNLRRAAEHTDNKSSLVLQHDPILLSFSSTPVIWDSSCDPMLDEVRGAALAPAHVSMVTAVVDSAPPHSESGPSNDAGVLAVDVAGAVAVHGDKDVLASLLSPVPSAVLPTPLPPVNKTKRASTAKKMATRSSARIAGNPKSNLTMEEQATALLMKRSGTIPDHAEPNEQDHARFRAQFVDHLNVEAAAGYQSLFSLGEEDSIDSDPLAPLAVLGTV